MLVKLPIYIDFIRTSFRILGSMLPLSSPQFVGRVQRHVGLSILTMDGDEGEVGGTNTSPVNNLKKAHLIF